MFHRRSSKLLPSLILTCLLLAAVSTTHAATPLTISGVTDRATYMDSVQFQVVSNAGFTYAVTLNGKPLPAGVTHTVSVMDYYDLAVSRMETATSDTTNALVRFIVESSRRGDPEKGLIEWTPYPPIPSGSGEFADGQLHVVAPQDYPAGLEIPVVAWVDDGPGNGRRVNGNVTAAGFEGSPLPLRRGVGHTFLPAAGAGSLAYEARIHALAANKIINIDTSTTWSNTSGILPAGSVWPANSRIRVTGNITISAGNTLTIEAGTIVLVNASVNITNSGRTVINGTTEQPVVFTAATRVAPEQHTGAWGGFLLRGASAELIAHDAIMTGAGASASFSFSPGSSHKSDQAVLLIHSGAHVAMTNCYIINNAGQVANGYNSDVTYDHCLLQRAITSGEYEGGTVILNNTAVIEFPAIDGEVNATIADADYDAIYFTTGTHILQNSLFGFSKDDAIDSGSGGSGTMVVSNCWVESALHEALAWSGEGRQTWSYDSVLMNCGQGIECGWSTGNNSPLCYGARLLSLGNSIGARYGDNYSGTTGLGLKTGFLTVTNSILLNNYHDVWGHVWDDTWNYRVNMMDIHDNFLTAPNTNHPNNTIWNPATDAARLLPFLRTPSGAAVGIGFANWNALAIPDLTNGVPIRLSTFTTNFVSFTYEVRTPNVVLTNGTLTFVPGQTVKRIYAPIAGLVPQTLVRVTLSDPLGGEFTTASQILIAPADTSANTNITLISFNSAWRYLDNGSDQGTAWRARAFNDTAWPSGPAQLGFGDGDEATTLRRTNAAGPTNITFYFRKTIQIANPAQFVALPMRLLRDDAGVVYVNGGEVFRSPNLPAFPTAINYLTLATATGENTIDLATLSASGLLAGSNVIAIEIHQQATTSSDVSFDFELIGNLAPQPPRLNIARFGSELVLYWADASYRLEATDALGQNANWITVTGATSPASVTPAAAHGFYRVKKP